MEPKIGSIVPERDGRLNAPITTGTKGRLVQQEKTSELKGCLLGIFPI